MCRSPCDELKWLAANPKPAPRRERVRVRGRRTTQLVEVQTMAVNETRVVDRGREDRVHVNALSRVIAVFRLVDPRPRGMELLRWRFDLQAWALKLEFGRRRAADIGRVHAPELGHWSERSVRTAVDEGRPILFARALRRRGQVEDITGLEVAACVTRQPMASKTCLGCWECLRERFAAGTTRVSHLQTALQRADTGDTTMSTCREGSSCGRP